MAESNGTGQPHGGKPRDILIILHGKRVGDPAFEEAVRELKSEGHTVKVRVTFESGDVDEFVKEALNGTMGNPPETLVAAGGDGTLNELVCALLKYKAPPSVSVGLIPYGTANDFAACNGISQDPREALHLAADETKIQKIDVGIVNDEVFLNTAAIGVGCEADHAEGAHPLKKMLGTFAIMLQGMQKMFGKGMQPTVGVNFRFPASDREDGAETRIKEFKGDLFMLVAGNCRQIARTVNVCPNAVLDDGLLDITFLFGSATEQIADLMRDVWSDGFDAAIGNIRMMRVPWIEVETSEKLSMNRDGEPTEARTKARFEVRKHAIRMHLPDDRMLMRGQADSKKGGKIRHRMMGPGKLRQMMTGVRTAPGRLLKL